MEGSRGGREPKVSGRATPMLASHRENEKGQVALLKRWGQSKTQQRSNYTGAYRAGVSCCTILRLNLGHWEGIG